MAWTPPNTVAPTFDSGYFVPGGTGVIAVPNVNSQSSTLWLLGIWVRNRTGAQSTLKLFLGDGTTEIGTWDIPDAFSGLLDEVPFMPLVGLKIQFGANSANYGAKLWGYQ